LDRVDAHSDGGDCVTCTMEERFFGEQKRVCSLC
jgi:hypothetical protein